MKWKAKTRLVAGMILMGFAGGVIAQEVAQSTDMKAVQLELANARQAVEDARIAAEQIVHEAQREAALIRQTVPERQQRPLDLEPVALQNSKVAVEIAAGTVEEIVTAIMPPHWRVMVDVKDQAILQRRFQFVSTKSRDQALRDLLIPLKLQHQYFFDLKDASGATSPLLVISKR